MTPSRGQYVGRLAPSPTGALHVGNVRTFMIAWLRARSQGGRIVLRMEDLDHPKDKPGAAKDAIEDLKWLGFDWDEEFAQSERRAIYRSAVNSLRRLSAGDGLPLVYPCACSRRDVEAAQSAPHDGEQLRYPGTCRGRFASWADAMAFKGAAPCWRFSTPAGTRVEFVDAFAGRVTQDVSSALGDFPLARDEDGAGYTLACTVDDLLMGVTEAVRGDDLLAATPAQMLLAQALLPWSMDAERGDARRADAEPPRFLHVPLVVGPDGRRLAKRHGDTRVATLRAHGMTPEEIMGTLAASCGWAERGERVSLHDLLPRFSLATIPHAPWTPPSEWLDFG